MRHNSLVRMEVVPKRLRSPFELICGMATGKSVLNVGAAGGVESYLPHQPEIWLHEKLRRAASTLLATDIDGERIAFAARHGYEIDYQDCETMALDQRFDLIVLSDVIEHVNSPVVAVRNLAAHLAPGGKLVITTPNATAANVIFKTMFRTNPNVFYDHMTTYYPEHFQAMCDRLNLKLEAVHLFDHMDRRTRTLLWKSKIMAMLTTLSPRLAGSQLCVIGNRK